jgi:hypothetical protein
MSTLADTRPDVNARRMARALAVLLWLAVAASAAWWALRLADRRGLTPVDARESQAPASFAAPLAWTALAPRLGATAEAEIKPAAAPPSDIRVLGVVVQGRDSRAVLSVEGGPPRPGATANAPQVLRVGERLAGGEEVLSIARDEVVLLRAGAGELRLPAPKVEGARTGATLAGKPGPATAVPPPPTPPANAARDAALQAGRQPVPGEVALPVGVPPGVQPPLEPPRLIRPSGRN